jgi:hypothetical protein
MALKFSGCTAAKLEDASCGCEVAGGTRRSERKPAQSMSGTKNSDLLSITVMTDVRWRIKNKLPQ